MCTAVAVPYSTLPVALVEAHDLDRRVHDRGGEKEVQFHYRAGQRLLPVWHDGELRIVRWGSRRGQTRSLPLTGWTWAASVAAGQWAGLDATEVVIPAALGYENGVWYGIREGIRGVLVHDESGRPAVYMMVEPASHYFEVMARSKRMAVLVGERI